MDITEPEESVAVDFIKKLWYNIIGGIKIRPEILAYWNGFREKKRTYAGLPGQGGNYLGPLSIRAGGI